MLKETAQTRKGDYCMMLKKRLRSAHVVLMVVFWHPVLCFSSEALKPLDEKVAVVNGAPIFKKDFLWAATSMEQHLISSGGRIDAQERKKIKKDALDGLIQRELLYQESRKKGITVRPSEIDREYQNLLDAMPREMDMETMAKELNLTEADIKKEFGRVLSIQKLLDAESPISDTVTEKEMRRFYDSHPERFVISGPVHAGHILIKMDPSFTGQQKQSARNRIEAIKQRLSAGEAFSELAVKYSEDASGEKGGDLGFFKRGQMEKPFEDAVFAMKQGQISKIIETRFGYHIIKVFEKSPETVVVFGKVKQKIEAYLKEEKINQVHGAFVQKLKDKAVIEVFTDMIR
jgi:peptidyl-prolyl cis-trans isomerase C